MDSKLTLKLNKSVIEQAKDYAKKNQVSLSRLIENYLASLTQKEKSKRKDIEITPFVKSLSGSIKLSEDFDYDDARYQYLMEKHK